jgi:hypothetical protein
MFQFKLCNILRDIPNNSSPRHPRNYTPFRQSGPGIMRIPRSQTDIRPTQFVFFPRLPLELRRIIWRFSIPGPRTVCIYSQKEAYVMNEDGHAACNPSISAKSNSKAPALLHTNRESRHIALKLYSLAFKEHLKQSPVYFCFSTDTLYVDNWHAVRCFFGRKKSYTQAKLLELEHLRKNLRILELGHKHFNTGWA